MSDISYWKAGKETEEKLREAAKDWKERVVPLARAMSEEVGAKTFVVNHGFFSTHVSGFQFETEPDNKLFVRLKGTEFFRPRVSTPLDKRMKTLKSDWVKVCKEILGIGEVLETPGIHFNSRAVVVKWSDTFEKSPIGCEEVTHGRWSELCREEST